MVQHCWLGSAYFIKKRFLLSPSPYPCRKGWGGVPSTIFIAQYINPKLGTTNIVCDER